MVSVPSLGGVNSAATQGTVNSADADPCAALFGSLKDECEKLRGSAGATQQGSVSLWDLLTNPVKFVGGIRHVFLRIAEVMVGGLLVVIGLNALVKAQTNVNVIGTAKKTVRKIV